MHKAIRLTSQIAMIVAAYDRIRKGKSLIAPDKSLSHAADFLAQLNGTKPSETAERALDILIAPALDGTAEIDADQLAEHAGIDPFGIVAGDSSHSFRSC